MTSTSSPSLFATPGSTDDGLVDGIRAQDDQAWEQLVERYSPLIYVWCRKCDLQPEDALDVSQQVFGAVHRSISTFSRRPEGRGGFRGWLFVITRNAVRNHLERTLRGPRAQGGSSIQLRLLAEPESLDEASLSAATRSADGRSDPHAPVQAALDAARRDFDERTWQCFCRIALEGHTAAEVAAQFGMKSSAVRQAKYRVTRRLRLDLGRFL
ncbi:RNA polymerase sigma factor [Planctomycetes bacterium TBK1r]|uniref:ECF RNA polymerase sigma factor SigE n=1 Tax=Stieleria magnilauensis TaxID=2527963 RepID=A0ABX5XN66_9BACT|nr:ECF RNA polymerase sigma factor SigE [Planctomycetes bacterium TBK1r]